MVVRLQFNSKYGILKKTLLFFGGLLVFGFLGEIFFIIQHHYRYNSGLDSPFTVEASKEFGWKPKDNFNLSYKTKDVRGNEFKIKYKSDKEGFRTFGELTSPKKKIFFIGDSFTQARDVSMEKTFYGLLCDDFEIFAYGAGGYGTFQEYLVLQKHINQIKPDVVVWQHHANDFFDNDHLLDRSLGYSGFLFDRPYLSTSRFKENRIFQLISSLSRSRFLYFIFSKLLIIESQFHSNSPFEDLKNDSKNMQRTFKTTQKIFKRVDKITGEKTKFLHFSVSYEPYFDEQFKQAIGKAFTIDDLSGQLGSVNNDIQIDHLGHWNEKGHRMVAEILRIKLHEIMDNEISIAY